MQQSVRNKLCIYWPQSARHNQFFAPWLCSGTNDLRCHSVLSSFHLHHFFILVAAWLSTLTIVMPWLSFLLANEIIETNRMHSNIANSCATYSVPMDGVPIIDRFLHSQDNSVSLTAITFPLEELESNLEPTQPSLEYSWCPRLVHDSLYSNSLSIIPPIYYRTRFTQVHKFSVCNFICWDKWPPAKARYGLVQIIRYISLPID